MKPHQLSDTNLSVTHVLYYKHQTSLFREERGENVVLVVIQNTKTNEKGHLYYEMGVDKRDIEHEETYTDNPKLFETEHPEAGDLQDLLSLADATTPSTPDEFINGIISACCEHSLEYREGNPKAESYEDKAWGMYPA